ncbi:hypothetical protein A2U01_0085400, partial [Trifolium medium]|nr:hypothetical protein [Trifolium medium]
MPDHFLSDGFRPAVSEIPMPSVQQGFSSPQVTVTVPVPVVHTVRQDQVPIFYAENMGGLDRVDNLQL